MTQLYIGLCGKPGAGKSTVARYLREKHGAMTYSDGAWLVGILKRLHLTPTRLKCTVLVTLIRLIRGEAYLVRRRRDDFRAWGNHRIVVNDGMRYAGTLEESRRTLPGFRLLYLHADAVIRYRRATARKQKPGEDAMSFEDFLRQDNYVTERVERLVPEADTVLNTALDEDQFFKRIDALIAVWLEQTQTSAP